MKTFIRIGEMASPEELDLSLETKATHKLYGMDQLECATDQPAASLLAELQSRGLLDTTLVI